MQSQASHKRFLWVTVDKNVWVEFGGVLQLITFWKVELRFSSCFAYCKFLKKMATHSSILAWRIPWTEDPGGLPSMGVAQSRTWLKRLSSSRHRFWRTGHWSLLIWVAIREGFSEEVTVERSERWFSSVQSLSRVRLCDPMNHSSLSVPHQLPEFTQIHVRRVSDAIQPSHPLSPRSPPAPNPSQHESLFQWVNSSHEVAKVLEFQL